MDILYVTQVQMGTHQGGVRHVQAIVQAFRSMGHKVTLIAPASDAQHIKKLVDGSITTYRSRPGMRLELELALRALHHIRTHKRPDVIYVRLSASTFWVPMVLGQLGIPIWGELNGKVADQVSTSSLSIKYLKRLVAGRTLPHAVKYLEGLILAEHAYKEHAKDFLRADKLYVVENGVDLSMVLPFDTEQAKEKLALPKDAVVVGFVGSLVRDIRLDWLVEAIDRIESDVILLIAGDGPQSWVLRNYSNRCPKKIYWLGQVPHSQAVTVMQASDILVSLRQTHPGLKALEYAAVGKRIAGFDTPGMQRIKDCYPDYPVVYVTQDHTVDGLVDVLRAAITSHGRLGTVPQHFIERAREHLGWEHTAKALISLMKNGGVIQTSHE